MHDVTRQSHLLDMVELLWREPLKSQLQKCGRSVPDGVLEEYVLIPNARNPRIVVPAHSRTAAAAVRGHGGGASVLRRMSVTTLAASLRVGLGHWVFSDRLRVYGSQSSRPSSSITGHLSSLFQQPVQLAFQVTRARANRKPVLRVLDAEARTLAFVKVGTNALTRQLVRNEADALRRLSEGRFLKTTIPDVLTSHSWREVELLVLKPLPIGYRSHRADAASIMAAAKEIGEVDGVIERSLLASSYWRHLGARLEACDDERAVELMGAVALLASITSELRLPFGAWHGDWAPWNMAYNGGQLLVWDFERFQSGVPLGMDAFHFALQTKILLPGLDTEHEIARGLAQAAGTVAPLGVPSDVADIVFVVYLLEIAARWLEDRQGDTPQWSTVLDGMVHGAVSAIHQVAGWRLGARGKSVGS